MTAVAEYMHWHMTDLLGLLCVFLLFSPKLRVSAFAIMLASIFNLGLEPMLIEFGRIQEQTGELVPQLYFSLALIDLVTAAFLAWYLKNIKDPVSAVHEALIFILVAASLVNVSIIVGFPQKVYDNYVEIFFVLGCLQIIALFIGGAKDAVGCITDVVGDIKRRRFNVAYDSFLFGRAYNLGYLEKAS